MRQFSSSNFDADSRSCHYTPQCAFFDVRLSFFPRTNLTDSRSVLRDLIVELLVHSHNQRVTWFDVAKSGLKALPDLRGAFDSPAGSEDFVREARFSRALNGFEHPRRIARQVHLAQRDFAEYFLKFFPWPRQIVQAAHEIIHVPAPLLRK